MNKLLASLLATCVLSGAAGAQVQTLRTTFLAHWAAQGQMFDIRATNAVEICSLDVHLDPGNWDLEVYTVTGGGSYVGHETDPAAWTLVGSAHGVVSNGWNVPTPLPIPIATQLAAGATLGFYVTVTSGGGAPMNVADGNGVGALSASDANLRIFDGSVVNYPFLLPAHHGPYTWNGRIHYVVGTGCPTPPWQMNSPISSLDIDGVQGTASEGAVTTVCVGSTSNLNSVSTPGTLTDVALSFTNTAPSLPLSTVYNTVNIDVFDPMLGNLNGAPIHVAGTLRLKPHPGAFSCPIPTGAPLVGSAQQLAVDATNPDGYTLSQACEINVTTGTALPLSHQDDGSIQVFLSEGPLCGTSVDFYGTSYTALYSNSNGTVSFNAGNANFTATSGEWRAQEPKIGIGTDLEPNAYGTVTVFNLGPGLSGSTGSSNIVVSYSNVTEKGTAGMGVSGWDIVLNGSNGHEIAKFTTDGTWGSTPCVGGITLGSAGTHPPLVSFDTVFGTGTRTNPHPTYSVIDENTNGMLINTTGWTTIQFPSLDGSSYVVL